MSTPAICYTCRRALDLHTNEDGATYVHSPLDADDHEAIPIVPGPSWRGRCDFCSQGVAEFMLPARDFRVPHDPMSMSNGDWGACMICAQLITTGLWDEVAERATTFYVTQHGGTDVVEYKATVGRLYSVLRQNIIGPITELGE